MVEIFDNIRKIYTFKAPCPELAAHIEFLSASSIEATQQYTTGENLFVKMFPSWTPTFYINLGEPYLIAVGNRGQLIRADQDILILRNSIVERHIMPMDNIFTVKFHPGGLEAVLGMSQLKCADKVIDLNTILPAKLIRRIKEQLTFAERCEVMEQFLLNSLKNKNPDDYYLKFVKDCMVNYQSADMQLNTGEMAERMFVSSKTINRYFNRVIGVSPKNYFSIMRARTALTNYVDQGRSFSPYDHGYYDMSHFYKEVVRFTGDKLTAHVI